ncbi:MAG: CDP-glucose 4,6-dehydratase [Planctomycetota bacterium]
MSNKLASFDALKGKRVFVTGHTGFKGSWLCLWLDALGCEVFGYALEAPTQPSNFTVSGIEEVVTHSRIADIRDAKELARSIDEFKPDLIMHLAAQSVVRHGYEAPIDTLSTNVMGTANVLEAVRKIGRPCSVLCVTSDKCYRNDEQAWGYRECDHLGESDPYGASKGAAELVIRSYRKSYFPLSDIENHGVRLASARAGNVIGGGDWTGHGLIADCVRAFAEGREVELRNPKAQRPWQHVLQCLSGYLTVSALLLSGDDPRICSAWNFGPVNGDELPVHEVVDYLANYWPGSGWTDVSKGDAEHESQILRLSIDKAVWELGWNPGWNVYQSLDATANWFLEYFSNPEKMREVCFSQIRQYEKVLFGEVGASP